MSTDGRIVALHDVEGSSERMPLLVIPKRGRFTETPALDSEVEAWVSGRGPCYVRIGAYAKQNGRAIMFHVTLPPHIEIKTVKHFTDGTVKPGQNL